MSKGDTNDSRGIRTAAARRKKALRQVLGGGEIFDRQSVRAVLVAGMVEQYLVQAILGAAQFG